MSVTDKRAIINGVFWSIVGQFGYLFLILATNAVLARYLSPSQFGQVGIVMFFILLFNIISEGGIGGALVRRDKASDKDFSTAFVFSAVLSILMFCLLFTFSNKIAHFFDDNELSHYLRVASVILLFNSFQVLGNARLIIAMDFKSRSLYRFISMMFASLIGILLAAMGNGVISVVYMQITYSALLALFLVHSQGLPNSPSLSWQSFLSLYRFGINTSLTSLLSAIFDNIYTVVIGKYFDYAQAGLYYQSKRIQDAPNNILNTLLQGVFFSSLAKKQDSPKLLHDFFLKITDYITAILGLIFILFFLFGNYVLCIVYGEEWVDGVIYLRLLVIAAYFYVQELIIRTLFKTIDKTAIILKIDVFKKIVQSATIFTGVFFHNLPLLVSGFILANMLSFYVSYKVSNTYLLNNERLNKIMSVAAISFALAFIFFMAKYYYSDTIRSNIAYFFVSVIGYFGLLQLIGLFNWRTEIMSLVSSIKG